MVTQTVLVRRILAVGCWVALTLLFIGGQWQLASLHRDIRLHDNRVLKLNMVWYYKGTHLNNEKLGSSGINRIDGMPSMVSTTGEGRPAAAGESKTPSRQPSQEASNNSSSSNVAPATLLVTSLAASERTRTDPAYRRKLEQAAAKPINIAVMTSLFWALPVSQTNGCQVDGIPLDCHIQNGGTEVREALAGILMIVSSMHLMGMPDQARKICMHNRSVTSHGPGHKTLFCWVGWGPLEPLLAVCKYQDRLVKN